MPKVPTTGIVYLNGNANGIKECVVASGGVPADDDIISVRNAAKWLAFDSAFLDGAASLADIKNTNQFRGYPKNNFNLTSGVFLANVGIANPGDVFVMTASIKRQSDNSTIGSATFTNIISGSQSSSPLTLGGNIRLGFNTLTRFLCDDTYFKTNYTAYYITVSGTRNGSPITLATGSGPDIGASYANSSGLSLTGVDTRYYDTDKSAYRFVPDTTTNPFFLRSITGLSYNFYFDDF